MKFFSLLAFAFFAVISASSFADEEAQKCPIGGCTASMSCYKNFGTIHGSSGGCYDGYPFTSCTYPVGAWTGRGTCPIVKNDDSAQPVRNAKTTAYWGYDEYAGMLKSPNVGRGYAAIAKLDVCFYSGYTTVDAFGNRAACHSACDSGSINTSCSNSGADTCYNRCDAVYPSEE